MNRWYDPKIVNTILVISNPIIIIISFLVKNSLTPSGIFFWKMAMYFVDLPIENSVSFPELSPLRPWLSSLLPASPPRVSHARRPLRIHLVLKHRWGQWVPWRDSPDWSGMNHGVWWNAMVLKWDGSWLPRFMLRSLISPLEKTWENSRTARMLESHPDATQICSSQILDHLLFISGCKWGFPERGVPLF